MKCLSVWQPWAELIVRGIKDVENRSWATSHRGPVLIHAGRRMRAGDLDLLAAEHGIELSRADLAFGAVLGVVDLVDCRSQQSSPWHLDDYIGWYFTNPRRLSEPIPCKGQLGLFGIPDEWLPPSWRP